MLCILCRSSIIYPIIYFIFYIEMEQDFISDATSLKSSLASPQTVSYTADIPAGHLICGFGGKYTLRSDTVQDPTGTLTAKVLLYVGYLLTKPITQISKSGEDASTEQIIIPSKTIKDAWSGSASAFDFLFEANEVATGFILNTSRINSATSLSNTTGFGFITRNTKTKEKKTYGIGTLSQSSRTKTYDTQTPLSVLTELSFLTMIEPSTQTVACEVTHIKSGVWEAQSSSSSTSSSSEESSTTSSTSTSSSSSSTSSSSSSTSSTTSPTVTATSETAETTTTIGQIIPGLSNTMLMIIIIAIISVILLSIIIYYIRRPKISDGTGRTVPTGATE
jgi:hypothetical protein